MSGGAHLHGLAPGQHSSEGTSQRWRAAGATADMTGLGVEPQTSRSDSVRLATEGFDFRAGQIGTMSPTARHRCDVSLELCSPGIKQRRWATQLVTCFGVIRRV